MGDCNSNRVQNPPYHGADLKSRFVPDQQENFIECVGDPTGRHCAAGPFYQELTVRQHKVSFSGGRSGYIYSLAIKDAGI